MTEKVTTKKKAPATKAPTKLSVVELGGKEVDSMTVPAYLTASVSKALVAQVIHSATARARVRRAHTKGRSEVRGGGRKPWKQKGTGRARHGSRRSPIWVGGGITFGPRSRRTNVAAVPARLRHQALAGALSLRVQDGDIQLVRFAKDLPTKTKEFATALGDQTSGLLLVTTAERAAGLTRVGRNISGLEIRSAADMTTRDVVRAKRVLIDETALPVVEQRCGATKKSN